MKTTLMKKQWCFVLVLILILNMFCRTVMSGKTAKAADNYDFLNMLNYSHPRIMGTSDTYDNIRKYIYNRDNNITKWYKTVKEDADNALNIATVSYNKSDGVRLKECKDFCKVEELTFVYLISGEEKYAQKAAEQLLAVCCFDEWNTSHFLDTAEIMQTVAVCYDRLYDYLSSEQKKTIRSACIKNGLQPALEAYKEGVEWTNTKYYNWNAVCNCGAGTLAAVLLDEDECTDICEEILQYSINSLKTYMLPSMEPDGACYEGPGYWYYTVRSIVQYLWTLESAFSYLFGADNYEGLKQTGYYPYYMTGSNGIYNFKEGAPNTFIDAHETVWIASHYQDNNLLNLYYDTKERYDFEGTVTDILLYSPYKNESTEVDADKYYQGTGNIILRTNPDDINGIFASMVGGSNGYNHAHMDVGSFLFDANGIRWAVGLPGDNYNLPGYFDRNESGGAWQYYRQRAEGHNTLVINPDSSGGQKASCDASANLIAFSKGTGQSFAAFDISPVYGDISKSQRRGMLLDKNNGSILIQDEFDFYNASTLYWFMHTEADITLSDDEKTACLKKNGKTCIAVLQSDINARFSIMDAMPLPTSPNPEKQASNNSYKKLTINADDVVCGTIAVKFYPYDNYLGEKDDIIPISSWKNNYVPRSEISNIYADGKTLYFDSENICTECCIDYDTDGNMHIPSITCSDAIEIKKPLSYPGTVVLKLNSGEYFVNVREPELNNISNDSVLDEYLSADFDSGISVSEYSPQKGRYIFQGAPYISELTDIDSGRALKLGNISGSTPRIFFYPQDNSKKDYTLSEGKYRLSCDFMTDGASVNRYILRLRNEETNKYSSYLTIGSDGYFYAGTNKLPKQCISNIWYHMDLYIDYEENEICLYLDGEELYRFDSTFKVSAIECSQNNTLNKEAFTYFDNITVRSIDTVPGIKSIGIFTDKNQEDTENTPTDFEFIKIVFDTSMKEDDLKKIYIPGLKCRRELENNSYYLYPQEQIQSSTQYKLIIPKGIRSVGGLKSEKSWVYTFRTETDNGGNLLTLRERELPIKFDTVERIIDENFDAEPITGIGYKGETTRYIFKSDVFGNNTKSLYSYVPENTISAEYPQYVWYTDTINSGLYHIGYDFCVSGGYIETSLIKLRNANKEEQLLLSLSNGGNFLIGGKEISQKVRRNFWYHVDVLLDFDQNSFDCFINNNYMVRGCPLVLTDFCDVRTSISKAQYNFNGIKLAIDNLIFEQIGFNMNEVSDNLSMGKKTDKVYETLCSGDVDLQTGGSENTCPIYIDSPANNDGSIKDGKSLMSEIIKDKSCTAINNWYLPRSYGANDGKFRLRYNFYIQDGFTETTLVSLRQGTANVPLLGVNDNGYLSLCGSTTHFNISLDRWYKAEILIDMKKRTFDTYVNGNIIGTENSVIRTSFNRLVFYTQNYNNIEKFSKIYIDDILLENYIDGAYASKVTTYDETGNITFNAEKARAVAFELTNAVNGAEMITAVYNDDGTLDNIAMSDINADNGFVKMSLLPKAENGQMMKIFIFESCKNIKPISEVKICNKM